jgi:hypothetical protein
MGPHQVPCPERCRCRPGRRALTKRRTQPTRTGPSPHFPHLRSSQRRRGGPPGAARVPGRLPDCRWRSTASPIPPVRQRTMGARSPCTTFSAGPPGPANPLRPGQFRRVGVRTRPRCRVGSATTALRPGGPRLGHQQRGYRLGRQQVCRPRCNARPLLDPCRPHPHPGRSLLGPGLRHRRLPPSSRPCYPPRRHPSHRHPSHRSPPYRSPPYRSPPHRSPPHGGGTRHLPHLPHRQGHRRRAWATPHCSRLATPP